MRNIGRSSGYAIHSRALKASRAAVHAPAGAADKVHAVIAAEVETLRLRVRALTTTNTNLRRRLKHLESQRAPKAVAT